MGLAENQVRHCFFHDNIITYFPLIYIYSFKASSIIAIIKWWLTKTFSFAAIFRSLGVMAGKEPGRVRVQARWQIHIPRAGSLPRLPWPPFLQEGIGRFHG